VLDLIGAGKSFQEIIGNSYPDLTSDDIRACLEFARDLVQNDPRRPLRLWPTVRLLGEAGFTVMRLTEIGAADTPDQEVLRLSVERSLVVTCPGRMPESSS